MGIKKRLSKAKIVSRYRNYLVRVAYAYFYDKYVTNDNLILYESFHGNQISGNPYAIYKQLVNDSNYKEYHHVWVVNDLSYQNFEILSNDANTVVVKRHSRKYLKALVKAKYLVNNTSFGHYFQKKPNQVYINTWHGTPFKKIGKDVKGAVKGGHENIQRNFLHVDYFVSPNKYTADKLLTSLDLDGIFTGKILDVGYPRIDLTMQKNLKDIKGDLGISKDKIVVLYAPTWRGTSDSKNMDHSKKMLNDIKLLKERLPNNYEVLLKVHDFDHKHLKKHGYGDLCVPNSVNVNELLSVVDILITDYSSIFYDFLPTEKPIIFYVYDSESYERERGFYYEVEDLPGPKCLNIKEVYDSIVNIEETVLIYSGKYTKALKLFNGKYDGEATKKTVDIIFRQKNTEDVILSNNMKKKILMYAGGFLNNGITIAAQNLSKYINYDEFDLTIVVDRKSLTKERELNIAELDSRTRLLYHSGINNFKLSEVLRHYTILWNGLKLNLFKRLVPSGKYSKEMQRLTGITKFDAVLDFSGYNAIWTLLIAHSNIERKVIYLHSDMENEYSRHVNGKHVFRKNLRVIFPIYDYFNRLVSVSESVNEMNFQNLGKYTKESAVKMVYVNNVIDYRKIYQALNYQQKSEQRGYLITQDRNPGDADITKEILLPNQDEITFVTIGRLSPEKDQTKLLKAFRLLRDQYPDEKITLYIIGDGPLMEELKDLSRNLAIQSEVIFTGYLENPYSLINQCSCVVNASNYEGQGLAILESLVIGKPVISTDVVGVRSVLKDDLGMLVDNSIEGLVEGMNRYIKGEYQMNIFNPRDYNEVAMKMFYQRVLK